MRTGWQIFWEGIGEDFKRMFWRIVSEDFPVALPAVSLPKNL